MKEEIEDKLIENIISALTEYNDFKSTYGERVAISAKRLRTILSDKNINQERFLIPIHKNLLAALREHCKWEGITVKNAILKAIKLKIKTQIRR